MGSVGICNDIHGKPVETCKRMVKKWKDHEKQILTFKVFLANFFHSPLEHICILELN